jgi:hypothetical protein
MIYDPLKGVGIVKFDPRIKIIDALPRVEFEAQKGFPLWEMRPREEVPIARR